MLGGPGRLPPSPRRSPGRKTARSASSSGKALRSSTDFWRRTAEATSATAQYSDHSQPCQCTRPPAAQRAHPPSRRRAAALLHPVRPIMAAPRAGIANAAGELSSRRARSIGHRPHDPPMSFSGTATAAAQPPWPAGARDGRAGSERSSPSASGAVRDPQVVDHVDAVRRARRAPSPSCTVSRAARAHARPCGRESRPHRCRRSTSAAPGTARQRRRAAPVSALVRPGEASGGGPWSDRLRASRDGASADLKPRRSSRSERGARVRHPPHPSRPVPRRCRPWTCRSCRPIARIILSWAPPVSCSRDCDPITRGRALQTRDSGHGYKAQASTSQRA